MRIRYFLSGMVLAGFLSAALTAPAQAAMLSTQQLATHAQRAEQAARVQGFVQRADVAAEFERLGVAPEQVQERLASLTDAELQQLVLNIDQQPAGGDALAVLGIVFLVLLVLELVGVTNVFSRF